jgi:hypothetical protein
VVKGRTTIKVCSREAILEKIGHSPDYATAYVLANMDTPRTALYSNLRESKRRSLEDYDPYARL